MARRLLLIWGLVLALASVGLGAPRVRAAATDLVAVPVHVHPRDMGVRSRGEYVNLLTKYARGRVSADEVRTRVGSRPLADLALRLVDEGVHYARNWKTELKLPSYYSYRRAPVEAAAYLAAMATHHDYDLDDERGEYSALDDFALAAPKGYVKRLETADRIVSGKARRDAVGRAFGEVPDTTRARPAPDRRAITRNLPKPGSPEFTALVDDARRSLELQGYAIVPTSRYISARVGRSQHARMSEFIGSYTAPLRASGSRAHPIDPLPEDFAPARSMLRWQHRFAEAIAGTGLRPIDQVYVREDAQGPIIDGYHHDGPDLVLGTDLIADRPRVYPTIKDKPNNGPRPVPAGVTGVSVPARDTVVLVGMSASAKSSTSATVRAIAEAHGPTAHGTAPGKTPRMLLLSGHSSATSPY